MHVYKLLVVLARHFAGVRPSHQMTRPRVSRLSVGPKFVIGRATGFASGSTVGPKRVARITHTLRGAGDDTLARTRNESAVNPAHALSDL